MNKIEKLVQQYCPNGVEFKTLGEVCKISRGRVMSKDYLRDNIGQYPVYSSQTTNNGIFGKIKTYDYEGEYLTWTTDGANAGSVFYRIGKFSITNVCGLLRVVFDKLSTKFLYYWLEIITKKYVNEGMGNPKLMSNVITIIPIPIPPMEVQREIVKILDCFTQLEAELEAELEARKTQYEYYRNELLTPKLVGDNNAPHDDRINSNKPKESNKIEKWVMKSGVPVEWKTLGDIGKICMCKRVMKHETSTTGKIPFFKIGTFGKTADAFIDCNLYENYRNKYSYPKQGEILISASGTIGRKVVFDGKDAYFQDSNIVWIANDETKIKNKFLFYLYEIVEWKTEGGTIARLYNDNLAKIKIPIPPLAEQERIVGILDKFDALVNDISIGLPAEIKARRQQYEHYRNQLLTFAKI